MLAGGNPLRNFDSIQTVTVGSGGQATITFSSIPATYTHLQIRFMCRDVSAGTGADDIVLRFNGDTASNYTFHYLYGIGGATYGSAGSATQTSIRGGVDVQGGVTAGVFGVNVTDILDYANTNKYKTTRNIGGNDRNGAGSAVLYSGLWRSTSAITSITLAVSGAVNWAQYSSFALYGIK